MNIAIVLAGGRGLRMSQDGASPKQFYSLADKPVLMHTLERFENYTYIEAICVVCLPTREDYLWDIGWTLLDYGLSLYRKAMEKGMTQTIK